MVPHCILVNKLYNLGIHGTILRWTESWLSNLKQRVVFNGELSKWKDVISGVVQGSFLGPILLLLFVSDLPTCMDKATIIGSYADYTKIGRVILSVGDSALLQKDVDALAKWQHATR